MCHTVLHHTVWFEYARSRRAVCAVCCSVPGYVDHHFKQFYGADHPVILCTDDSGEWQQQQQLLEAVILLESMLLDSASA
jgi:hypothetical protein